ncbi:MAG: DUF7305 domain-containing protein, partial [Planctomycetota bacterium]
ERSSRVAYYAAQAGLADAKIRLKADTADTRGYADYLTTDIDDTTWRKDISGELPNGTIYNATITHAVFWNGTAWSVNRKGNGKNTCGDSEFPCYRVTSTGSYLNSEKTLEEYVYLKFVDLWSRAVTTCGPLQIDSNAGTNSYDSSACAYDEDTCSGVEGDIYTSGDVTLLSNTDFDGDITTSASILFEGNSKITGDATAEYNIALSTNNNILTGNATAGNIITVSKGVITGNATAGTSVQLLFGGTVNGDVDAPATVTPATVDPPEACTDEHKIIPRANIADNNDNSGMTCYDGSSTSTTCPAECIGGSAMCTIGQGSVVYATLEGGAESSPKQYYFKGLAVESNSFVLTAGTGYVEIYVEGDFWMKSNTVLCGSTDAADGSPIIAYTGGAQTDYDCGRTSNENLNTKTDEILVHVFGRNEDNNNSTVVMESNGKIFGRLYAPDASQTNISSNSSVFGAVIAGGMCSGCGSGGGVNSNAGIHYDTMLEQTETKASSMGLVSRKECFYGTLIAADDSGIERFAAGSCALKP